MNVIVLGFLTNCYQNSNTDRWNSFLNYGLKKHVNQSFYVHAAFKNVADYPINIYKTNYNRNTLNPNGIVEAVVDVGKSIKIPCFIGDTFTAKVASRGSKYDGLLLLAHDVSRVYINENSCDQKTFKICDRKPFDGSNRWTPPDSLMFSSLTDKNTSLYFWDGQCEEHIQQIVPNQDYHIMSTLGHSFRMRDDETNKLILEYNFEEILIKGLEDDNDYEISEKATQLFDSMFIDVLKHNIESQQQMLNNIEEKYTTKTC